jgi:hypothetical protein
MKLRHELKVKNELGIWQSVFWNAKAGSVETIEFNARAGFRVRLRKMRLLGWSS